MKTWLIVLMVLIVLVILCILFIGSKPYTDEEWEEEMAEHFRKYGPVPDDEGYDERVEPNGYYCLRCGNIQAKATGFGCDRCGGPVREWYH